MFSTTTRYRSHRGGQAVEITQTEGRRTLTGYGVQYNLRDTQNGPKIVIERDRLACLKGRNDLGA